MSDLRDLYQEVILDHNKQPRNFRELDDPTHEGKGYNPLCGDRVDLYVRVEDEQITEVSFQGSGCAISTASASLLTEAIRGRSLAEARAIFESFQRLVTGKATEEDEDRLGKLAVFAGIRDYPTRVKCATLVWHTLTSALDGSGVARTE